jgi:hypothetical protein
MRIRDPAEIFEGAQVVLGDAIATKSLLVEVRR